jgi:hypothetical protein
MADSQLVRLADLADRLLARTEDLTLQWEETDLPREYVTVLQGGSVRVRSTGSDYRLSAHNERGAVLEEASVSPDDVFMTDPGQVRLAKIVPRLHEAVRRIVLDVDTALESFLNELG